MLLPLGRDAVDQLPAGLGERDPDHPAVDRVAPPLHEAAPLHPVDDAGGAGLRDIEGLGDAAHRQRAVDLEDRQDVEMDEAQGPPGQRRMNRMIPAGVCEASSSSSSARRVGRSTVRVCPFMAPR